MLCKYGITYDCGERGTHFFNGIYYWTFELENEVYTVYEVGFGHRAIYYCVYFEGKNGYGSNTLSQYASKKS